jgi:hypothetical protein
LYSALSVSRRLENSCYPGAPTNALPANNRGLHMEGSRQCSAFTSSGWCTSSTVRITCENTSPLPLMSLFKMSARFFRLQIILVANSVRAGAKVQAVCSVLERLSRSATESRAYLFPSSSFLFRRLRLTGRAFMVRNSRDTGTYTCVAKLRVSCFRTRTGAR